MASILQLFTNSKPKSVIVNYKGRELTILEAEAKIKSIRDRSILAADISVHHQQRMEAFADASHALTEEYLALEDALGQAVFGHELGVA